MRDDKSYLSTLSKSMVMSLETFYKELNVFFLIKYFFNFSKFVSVSSLTGSGFDDLFVAIEKAKKEYFE